MPDWKTQLVPASFRGVAFFYLDADQAGGRRLAEFEFPLRDAPFIEDLGRRAKQYRFVAYVLGDDYFAQRDNLITALEAAGSGTLQHPYRGPIDVFVREYRVAERTEDGRMAVFDIDFIESGAQPSPVSTTDTATAGNNAAATLASDAQASFDATFNAAPGYQTTALSSLLSNLLTALAPLLSWAGLNTSKPAADIAGLAALTAAPAIATAIGAFFADYAKAVIVILPVVPDATQTSRGIPRVSDYTYGLALLASWGNTLPAVTNTAPQAVVQATNQNALIALVQQSALAAIATIFAATQFTSANDADAARALVLNLIDAASLIAPDDTTYQDLIALGQTVSNDLTARGKQLPYVVNTFIGAPLPAVVLAQRFYQDPSRAGELVGRNDPPCPLFMPVTVEALSF